MKYSLHTFNRKLIKNTNKLPKNFTGIANSTGAEEYWYNGKYHRLRGPAIETKYGDKFWYKNGSPHRTTGPAFVYAHGTKEYWIDGKRHRVGGPAIIHSDGTKSYFINGEKYTEQEHNFLYVLMKLKNLL